MTYLVDTNVFLRLVPQNDPDRPTVINAIRRLRELGEDLCYTTQVLAEFWTVCTRPATARGGYGLSAAEAERKVRVIERYFRFLPDSLATHQEWRRLIAIHAVSGVAAHDARLVSSMMVHRITHILSFDTGFDRYPGITSVSPSEIQ